jgi:hypothetical protein
MPTPKSLLALTLLVFGPFGCGDVRGAPTPSKDIGSEGMPDASAVSPRDDAGADVTEASIDAGGSDSRTGAWSTTTDAATPSCTMSVTGGLDLEVGAGSFASATQPGDDRTCLQCRVLVPDGGAYSLYACFLSVLDGGEASFQPPDSPTFSTPEDVYGGGSGCTIHRLSNGGVGEPFAADFECDSLADTDAGTGTTIHIEGAIHATLEPVIEG